MDALLQFVPLILIGGILGSIMVWAAGKLGKNRLLWFVLGALPLVNMFFLWIAVWGVVVDLSRRVAALEAKATDSSPPISKV